MRDGALVLKSDARPINAGPYIISDTMDAIRSMADGQMYDSKRAYAKGVRAAGCEIVGNDKTPPSRPQFSPTITGHDIKAAIEQTRSRR